MEQFLQQIASGLANGAIYACVALALVMIYVSTDHINFAQGEMAMFSTYLSWQLMDWGMSFWVAFIIAVALSFVNSRLIPDVLDQGWIGHKLTDLGLNFQFTEISFGIFGFILVIMMVLRPEGLLPERRRQMELTEGIGDTESVFEARA